MWKQGLVTRKIQGRRLAELILKINKSFAHAKAINHRPTITLNKENINKKVDSLEDYGTTTGPYVCVNMKGVQGGKEKHPA